jgi:glutathione S-transferase
MAIILYHDVPSSNCDRVKIALSEKKLAWEGVSVSLAKREQKNPDHLKRNPYGKIPVIDDGGKILFESCIINEYLDEKYPDPPLMPTDPYLRARGRILIDYALNYIHAPYWALRGEAMKPAPERNQTAQKEHQAALRELLRYLEEDLSGKHYFLGDFSLTDIAIIPRFLRMESYGAMPALELPELNAWLGRMKERPSVRAIL